MSGDFYISPALGIFYPINEKQGFSLSVAYDRQNYNAKRMIITEYDDENSNSTISVKVGWFY
ncbi:MAG: hypothetical protein PHR13_11305 [Dysgonamonadaceae bacterium]|nr:hypothetical protein [Dysgonamonadaceae bacterium]MDD3901622.1 hypothetical protein [Dysgonamonadaceae bacterium]MDD4400076.1 hypothetical protein [Dysgonamonadaceae bacterium]